MRSLRSAGATLAALALAAAGAARADVFSPGDLAKAHQNLEGLSNCTKCHVAGERLSAARCLECHKEVASRIEGGRGLHGRIPPADRACEKCHHEHQGRDFALVEWGPAGRKGFDHARTGFELKGKHRRTDCARCHDRRLVKDERVEELLAKQPNRQTWLGAPAACASCHFDEHRGQLPGDCGRCHGEEAWKPARRFDHARTAYRLEGKHHAVACAKCHRTEQEEAPHRVGPAQTPPVNASAFVRYKGMPFGTCTDCHKDPHVGRFGDRCASCHTVADWRKVTGAGKQSAFHEKTRYPLRGAHVEARCAACHGPFPGVKARYRGLPFARCTDCHLDAHLGQLASAASARARPASTVRVAATVPAAPAARTCDACHVVEGWLPVRFEEADHARLDYRLEGAHRTVACALCHPKDPRLEKRLLPAVRRDLERRKRPVQVSLAVLDVPRANDCRTCHRDPHAGQFEKRTAGAGCTACHGLDSFRRLRFDHARDSRYPLDGKHAAAACGACHRPDAAGVVRWRPLATACASCHADPHAGQFVTKAQGNDCARCHATVAWKELRFRHAPPFTRYVLEGKHEKAACEKCHAPVRVAGQDVRRYRPLATECQACHADFHKGAFAAYAPASAAQAAPAPVARATAGGAKLSLRSLAASRETRCVQCHRPDSWASVTFDHARTGFPLEGAHRAAGCKACHQDATFEKAVPSACSGCHQDVHQGRLGRRCDRCHEAASWAATTLDADAHRRSAFPLSGRHAFTPCDSCHGDKRDRGFTRPTPQCIACHDPDWQRASGGGAAVNHATAGFPQTCQGCHGAWRFTPASLPAHEACFAIRHGPHAGIRCMDCHTSLPAVDYAQPFPCTSDTAGCIRCHSCADHPSVAGFACANGRCYECHRFATGG